MAPCPAGRNPAGIGVAQATQLATAGVRVTVCSRHWWMLDACPPTRTLGWFRPR